MDDDELREFLEIFAHKMRNPAHAAMINLDVAKNKIKKITDDKALARHLEIVETELKKLNKLTEKFIAFLKLPQNKRDKIDLKEYLTQK